MAFLVAFLVSTQDPAALHDLFKWIESTAISIWVRESITIWAFPMILACHTIGMAFVAGTNAVLDLRILGVAPRVPLLEMKRFFPVMWFGFWLNAASGVALLLAYPTKALTNPVFYTKLTLIAIAMVVFRAIQRRMLPDAGLNGRNGVRRLAGLSLACWGGAIVAGRLLAYTYRHLTSIDQ